MALIFPGKTICPICRKVIEQHQNFVAFPPFVANELDPLRVFNDGAFHTECFQNHPLQAQAVAWREEYRRAMETNYRICHICQRLIENPDEYFALGYLTSDNKQPLFPYNYLQFHQECLKNWPELAFVYEHLANLKQAGNWKGRAIDWLLDELGKALHSEQ
jgi:hypothetical protein